MSNYIVYELWNPIKDLPFYVGYSSKDTRPYDHIAEALQDKSECKIGANPHKIFTIRQIHKSNLAIGIKIVLITNNKHDAISEEIRLIKYYGRKIQTKKGSNNFWSYGISWFRDSKKIISRRFLYRSTIS